MTRTCA